MNHLFHGTSKKNLESIMEDGAIDEQSYWGDISIARDHAKSHGQDHVILMISPENHTLHANMNVINTMIENGDIEQKDDFTLEESFEHTDSVVCPDSIDADDITVIEASEVKGYIKKIECLREKKWMDELFLIFSTTEGIWSDTHGWTTEPDITTLLTKEECEQFKSKGMPLSTTGEIKLVPYKHYSYESMEEIVAKAATRIFKQCTSGVCSTVAAITGFPCSYDHDFDEWTLKGNGKKEGYIQAATNVAIGTLYLHLIEMDTKDIIRILDKELFDFNIYPDQDTEELFHLINIDNFK